jgi:NAD(P)-dependent dehydrogenase (short-subunit alcohol dehydrogenase family)
MKTIVIIGGSSGIGEAIVQETIATHHIINISRTEPELKHPNFTHITCDVLNDALPEIETIDTLIYCPGSINLKPINSLTETDFESDFKINVLGAVKVIKQYLKVLKKSENASILLFSSVATVLGMPYHASIAASKGAVEGLTKSLAAELAPTIRVNAIAPTITETPLASKILRNDTVKDALNKKHPLKKYLDAKDVALLAQYLISENAGAITGQIHKIDAGLVSITS